MQKWLKWLGYISWLTIPQWTLLFWLIRVAELSGITNITQRLISDLPYIILMAPIAALMYYPWLGVPWLIITIYISLKMFGKREKENWKSN